MNVNILPSKNQKKRREDFRTDKTYLLLVTFKSGNKKLWIYKRWSNCSERIVELGSLKELDLSLASTLYIDDQDIEEILDITDSATLTIQL